MIPRLIFLILLVIWHLVKLLKMIIFELLLCSGKNVFSQIAHFTQESGAEAPLPVRNVIL